MFSEIKCLGEYNNKIYLQLAYYKFIASSFNQITTKLNSSTKLNFMIITKTRR